MAFTTWTALRTAMKDRYADHIAHGSFVASYSMENRTLAYSTEKEFWEAYGKTYELEALESAGEKSNMVSYGRYRRFR